jgi:hypothetical protein
VLTPARASLHKGVAVNCFNGSAAALATYTRTLDMHVVITGLLCNDARAAELRDALKGADSARVLLGTDAPHLTPTALMQRPYPKINVPCTLPHVAAYLALLRAGCAPPPLSADEIAAANAAAHAQATAAVTAVVSATTSGAAAAAAASAPKAALPSHDAAAIALAADIGTLAVQTTRTARLVYALPTPVRSTATLDPRFGCTGVTHNANVYKHVVPRVPVAKPTTTAAAAALPAGITEADVFLYKRKVCEGVLCAQ